MGTPSLDEALASARSRFPVLAGVPPGFAMRLASDCQVMTVPPGTRLFDERSPCGAFPLVIEGRVKVAISLVKGKQLHDKRETIRKREVDRETRAAVKERARA